MKDTFEGIITKPIEPQATTMIPARGRIGFARPVDPGFGGSTVGSDGRGTEGGSQEVFDGWE